MTSEKRVTYLTNASYCVQNPISEKTRYVWLVFHGMGYLSRYFLKYFSDLDPDEHFIIAPQAPSKYYIGPKNKHVGASWLTKEDTLAETKNVLAYIDAVWQQEDIPERLKLIVLGYSQGVSIAMRWLSSRRIQCDVLVLHSGGIPKELEPRDFAYMNRTTQIYLHYGLKDPYLDELRMTEETDKAQRLFGTQLQPSHFDGTHEFDIEFLQNILQELNI